MPLRIDDVHLFIASDEEGEGVIGMKRPDGSWVPFVCADATRVEHLRPLAIQIGRIGRKEVKLVRFSQREEVEIVYSPGSTS